MQEFIHSLTGTRMFVADDRVEEYRAAGHRPVETRRTSSEDSGQKEQPAPDKTAEKKTAARKAGPAAKK